MCDTDHVVFAAARVQHKAQEQLRSNAAQRPHVNGCCVGMSQDDLWRPSSRQRNTNALFCFFVSASALLEIKSKAGPQPCCQLLTCNIEAGCTSPTESVRRDGPSQSQSF